VFESAPGRRLLILSGGTENNRRMNSLGYLAAANVVIWVGLFVYLWRLDRRIAGKERER